MWRLHIYVYEYVELSLTEAEEEVKVKLFYNLIGETGRELCETLMSDVTSARRKLSDLTRFDEHCNPKVNETVERYRFFMRNQGNDESIDSYVTDLRVLASTCNFGEIKDSLIPDRIVCGNNNSGLRERFLREDKLTLDKCLQLCRATESSRENSRTIEGNAVEEVHMVRHKAGQDKSLNTVSCMFCGNTHERNKRKCPAFGKRCKKCGKENHFAVRCKSKTEKWKEGKQVHTVTEQDSDDYEDILSVTTRDIQTETDKGAKEEPAKNSHLFAGMLVDKELVQFQIDCGAKYNVIPINLVNPDIRLEPTKKVLLMYNKTKLYPLGKCKVKVRNLRNQKLGLSLWWSIRTVTSHYSV
ncbi:uncharacterized protein LOC126392184 [Epinephelus moara]|uniref:uncharacterized protein LOC126392184 n=1 Tax=Epinephelus moara TaxID=300413 RepID=UPI00214E61A3|nr:uncharacterized protein LOC126392184 [Epinephelus moara]